MIVASSNWVDLSNTQLLYNKIGQEVKHNLKKKRNFNFQGSRKIKRLATDGHVNNVTFCISVFTVTSSSPSVISTHRCCLSNLFTEQCYIL